MTLSQIKTAISAILVALCANTAHAKSPCSTIVMDNDRIYSSLHGAFDTWQNGRPAPQTMPAKLDSRTMDVFNLLSLINQRLINLKQACPAPEHQFVLVQERKRFESVRSTMGEPVDRLFEMMEP